MITGIAILALAIFIYSIVSKWLSRWSISMPMVFVLAGLLLGPGGLNVLPIHPDTEGMKELTEITLALVLFADASTLNLRKSRQDAGLPARLLLIGLPLTIALGALLAAGLFPAEGLAVAAILGSMLAPTDAALGLPIFNNKDVPERIRRALNIESGLNDGIATPFVILFISIALGEHQPSDPWLRSALIEIGLAVVVGSLVGVLGGWLLAQTVNRDWTAETMKGIAILGLGLGSYVISLAVGGNGFIAAFVAGIVFGAISKYHFAQMTELTESSGSFLSILVWTVFGAILVPAALKHTTDLRPILYAVFSLTLIRMIPVALAMIGTKLRRDTVTLMGWFGPRGLASVVFIILTVLNFQEVQRPSDTLVIVATWTILLSVLAHGLSAKPLSAWYARRLSAAKGQPGELVEFQEQQEIT